jgi:hypothetical protein
MLLSEHPLTDDAPRPKGTDELVEVTAFRMLLVKSELTVALNTRVDPSGVTE